MKTRQTIQTQYTEMINRGTIPVIEIEIPNDEYLVVLIDVTDKGVRFEFDQDDKKVWFDGEIKGASGFYTVPFDDCFTQLDDYLEMIMENITEGFLMPNELYI